MKKKLKKNEIYFSSNRYFNHFGIKEENTSLDFNTLCENYFETQSISFKVYLN